jgi:hypothetical protein
LVAVDVRADAAELALTRGVEPRVPLRRWREGEGNLDAVVRGVMEYRARTTDDYEPWKRGTEIALERLEERRA